MDTSIFTHEQEQPTNAAVIKALGNAHDYWNEITAYVKSMLPGVQEEWKNAGKKYGWSFRLKDKKRVIIYLLPRQKALKVSLVFGQKAVETVMESNVSDQVKHELSAAKVYAEGRGIKLDVDRASMSDIRTLVDIKLSH